MSRLLLTLVLVVFGLIVVRRLNPTASAEANPLPAAVGAGNREPSARPSPPPVAQATTSPEVAPVASQTPSIDRLVRIETRRRLAQSAQYTYIDSMLTDTDSTLRRWSDRDGRPLTVAFRPSDLSGFSPRLVELAKAAARQWEGLELGIRFAEASDTVGADIVVQWIEKFEQDRTGQTDIQSGPDGAIFSARITLALKDKGGRTLSDPELTMVAIHEFGHALGLPHSAQRGDVMYPIAAVTRLSERDRATAMLLYSLPPGALQEPSS